MIDWLIIQVPPLIFRLVALVLVARSVQLMRRPAQRPVFLANAAVSVAFPLLILWNPTMPFTQVPLTEPAWIAGGISVIVNIVLLAVFRPSPVEKQLILMAILNPVVSLLGISLLFVFIFAFVVSGGATG